jgi:hypothetical protein
MAHTTIALEHNGRLVEVDVGIAPLIETLWSRNIETVSSCEDIDSSQLDFGAVATGSAYVAFPPGGGARRFSKSARMGRAVDPLVETLTVRAENIDASADPLDPVNEGVTLGVQTVLFPASRIAALAERLRL